MIRSNVTLKERRMMSRMEAFIAWYAERYHKPPGRRFPKRAWAEWEAETQDATGTKGLRQPVTPVEKRPLSVPDAFIAAVWTPSTTQPADLKALFDTRYER